MHTELEHDAGAEEEIGLFFTLMHPLEEVKPVAWFRPVPVADSAPSAHHDTSSSFTKAFPLPPLHTSSTSPFVNRPLSPLPSLPSPSAAFGANTLLSSPSAPLEPAKGVYPFVGGLYLHFSFITANSPLFILFQFL